ncbi:hypothetical protein BOTBODRAFT_62339 [Botryobasidium botryosum FD-172 SS1]|uniref:Uncharacterized protein n=1 Tax=Botryobasidium botryosum (strain FD-172 SS1) TaxID=930990 RepID=A0A067MW46_BOTB1|nr:hypothetical protein BOTBODRAFT_62339 [Botryobasidium botryosum FD-172 SS1]
MTSNVIVCHSTTSNVMRSRSRRVYKRGHVILLKIFNRTSSYHPHYYYYPPTYPPKYSLQCYSIMPDWKEDAEIAAGVAVVGGVADHEYKEHEQKEQQQQFDQQQTQFDQNQGQFDQGQQQFDQQQGGGNSGF